jgi:hypothetical protein
MDNQEWTIHCNTMQHKSITTTTKKDRNKHNKN